MDQGPWAQGHTTAHILLTEIPGVVEIWAWLRRQAAGTAFAFAFSMAVTRIEGITSSLIL